MMQDEIVTCEVAKLAKDKGFPLQKVIKQDGRAFFYELPQSHPDWANCDAWYLPTQSLLQRWLREERGVVFGISPMQEMGCEDLGWCATIYKVDENGYSLSWKEELYYNTYELVLENAMKYALENLV
jgi:hypothetical protein